MNPEHITATTGLVEALSPLLQGPTAGLITVLILLLGAGWLAARHVLPLWREVIDRQNNVLVGIQSALESLTADIRASTASLAQRLDRVEAELEDLGKDVGGLRRDAKAAAKTTGDKS